MPKSVQQVDFDKSGSGYYSAATVHTGANTIYISGQAGVRADGSVPEDYVSQIHLALLGIRKILIAASESVSSILKLTLYIVDYDPKNRKHTTPLRKFLGCHKPAVTLVPVSQLALPGWLFEVDAVVARKPAMPPKLEFSFNHAAETPTVDVVVIGAGLAGLTAAEKIIQAGYSCVVLEARDRVGGRTWSVPTADDRGMIDVGAAWLNRTNQSRVYALAQRFGVELIEQNTTGKCVLQDRNGKIVHFAYGELPEIDTTNVKHLAQIRDMVESDCQQLDSTRPSDSTLDTVTFADYIRRRGADADAQATAAVWTRAMLGQEPENVSALFFLHYCKAGGGLLQMRSDREGGGQHIRIRQGTQRLSICLASSLPAGTVRLSTAVNLVERLNASKMLVKGPNVKFMARKVISAVPPPVLPTISFVPALSVSKRLLSSAYNYGYYTKAIAAFRTPFWVAKGFCGLVQSFTGPISIIRDTSVPPDKQYMLTCFLVGAPGLEWSQLSQLARKDALLEQIGEVYGEPTKAREEFLELVESPWIEEEFSGHGCPSPSLAPGVLDSVVHADAIRTPEGDVHFVGTETSDVWKGYMEGAVRSGERGAQEVVVGLQHVLAKI